VTIPYSGQDTASAPGSSRAIDVHSLMSVAVKAKPTPAATPRGDHLPALGAAAARNDASPADNAPIASHGRASRRAPNAQDRVIIVNGSSITRIG